MEFKLILDIIVIFECNCLSINIFRIMTESCYLSEEKGLELLENVALSFSTQSSSSQKEILHNERIESESIPGDDVNILSELDSKIAVETIDVSRGFRYWLDTQVKSKQIIKLCTYHLGFIGLIGFTIFFK